MFGKRELFLTYDAIELQKITRMLDCANIRYAIRSDDFGRSNRGAGLLGSLGENRNYKIMYYVYVRKKDYDYAKSVIDGRILLTIR